MQSVWDEQTVKPDEVVLVEDGPLTDGLYQAIGEWKERLANILQVHQHLDFQIPTTVSQTA
jgi:hypothetical protein